MRYDVMSGERYERAIAQCRLSHPMLMAADENTFLQYWVSVSGI